MTRDNKFGFAPVDDHPLKKRERSVGPMGAAVREAAENMQDATEAKVEQRRQNAADAKEFRAAQTEGRLLLAIPLRDISTTDLPRDRIDLAQVANSDEMDELKTSIRERGQKEPIEVYRDTNGNLQLKKGWRRLTALTQLHQETGDDRFSTVLARIDGARDRLDHYIDMVEENVVREDLSFAEMAQVCILAARDEEIEEISSHEMVARLYGSLHKMKKSYIRSFVFLLEHLGEDLKFPKAIPRNLGVDVARSLKSIGEASELGARLRRCDTAEAQNKILSGYLKAAKEAPKPKSAPQRSEKREFKMRDMKVTVRNGECRIVGDMNFAGIDIEDLEAAVRAFDDRLKSRNVRITSL